MPDNQLNSLLRASIYLCLTFIAPINRKMLTSAAVSLGLEMTSNTACKMWSVSRNHPAIRLVMTFLCRCITWGSSRDILPVVAFQVCPILGLSSPHTSIRGPKNSAGFSGWCAFLSCNSSPAASTVFKLHVTDGMASLT